MRLLTPPAEVLSDLLRRADWTTVAHQPQADGHITPRTPAVRHGGYSTDIPGTKPRHCFQSFLFFRVILNPIEVFADVLPKIIQDQRSELLSTVVVGPNNNLPPSVAGRLTLSVSRTIAHTLIQHMLGIGGPQQWASMQRSGIVSHPNKLIILRSVRQLFSRRPATVKLNYSH